MKQLTRLFIPICLETLFYMLSGMVDTLMLSAVGDYAVGAVGTANSYIGIFIIMFSIISSGMVSVMTQNIGAGRPGVAYQARQLGLLFNAVAGVLMAVFLLYRKFLKSSEIVYNRLEIKNDITKERRGLRHDVVYEVFCFGLG